MLNVAQGNKNLTGSVTCVHWQVLVLDMIHPILGLKPLPVKLLPVKEVTTSWSKLIDHLTQVLQVMVDLEAA